MSRCFSQIEYLFGKILDLIVLQCYLPPVKIRVMLKNKMQNLNSHEHIVLDILVSGIIADDTLKDIKSAPNISKYDITVNGYFLTIKHPRLPVKRIGCDKPMLIAECSGIETDFIVFIENGELTIECHGWGDKEIPQNYREFEIQIKKA